MKTKVETFDIINERALIFLGNRDFLSAQEFFRKNVKKNPCHVSFNNMGVFYTFEGMELPNGKIRNARKLGMKYLKKAEEYQKSNLTFLALGDVFFENKDYEEASRCFSQACGLKCDYASMYNLALSFYRQELYKEALKWFEKALDVCEKADHDKIFEAYLFSLLQIDKKMCREKLSHLLETNIVPMDIDVFVLAYLCDELQAAERQIEYYFKHFSLDLEEMAMAFDCLFKLNKREEAQKYLELQMKSLNGYDYNVQPEIQRLKKVFSDDEYRKNIASSFRYIRPLIKQCCYYGCKKHNN
jgi:Tetratricopeptide repeat.